MTKEIGLLLQTQFIKVVKEAMGAANTSIQNIMVVVVMPIVVVNVRVVAPGLAQLTITWLELFGPEILPPGPVVQR